MTKTVPVPPGKSAVDYQNDIKTAQNTAKMFLLNQIMALGGLDATYDTADTNKIIITITDSTKSADEIKAQVDSLKSGFDEANKNNHISFAGVSVTSSDGECGGRKIKGRSPAKDGGRRRKGSPKRY